jgi:uncharacterized protein
MPERWPGLIIVGIVAGVMSGMFGIGGGVIIVPALAVFLGFTTIEAISTSLGALLFPVGVFAVMAYYRAGLMDLRASMSMAIGLLLTSALGALGALQIDAINPDLMQQVYGVFLLLMSWRFIEPRQLYKAWRIPKIPVDAPPKPLDPPVNIETYKFFGIGLVAGVFSGMFGIGGGIVIVPMLVLLFGFDQKKAVGTSLGALLFPVGLPGVLVYAQDGVLDFPVAVGVAGGLVIGAFLGANIALNLSSITVKRLYGLFILGVGLRFLFGG